jgi:hypothetical protein
LVASCARLFSSPSIQRSHRLCPRPIVLCF